MSNTLSKHVQERLALVEEHRHAFNYENAIETLDAARQSQGFSPTDLNAIQLRKLAHQIEYYWLVNRLADELTNLQSQLKTTHADALLCQDAPQIAQNLFLTARLGHFYLFVSSNPDLDTVEQAWITAYNHYQQLNDARGMAESLFYRGLLYQRFKSDQEEAFRYFQQAHDLLKDKSYPIEQSEIYRHSGYVHQHRGHLKEAQACYEQAVTLLDQAGFSVYLPLALYALGMVLVEQGHLEEATPYLERGLAVAEEGPLNILQIGALLSLGDLSIAKGDRSQARDYFQQSHDIASTLNSARFIKIATDKLSALTV